MEPVSLILNALASGAVKGIADSTTDTVKDTYSRLRQAISERFAGVKTAEVALAKYADDPETWKAPIAKALIESGAVADPAIIEASQQLMALLDEAGTLTGKYKVDARRALGLQVGDGNQQINMFTR